MKMTSLTSKLVRNILHAVEKTFDNDNDNDDGSRRWSTVGTSTEKVTVFLSVD